MCLSSNINLPLDTIEHLAWASNLDWGFNKHPPLVAFVLEFFFQIFGSQDWAYYFLSQIFVIVAFIYVWKFSNLIFKNKFYSLCSVLLLEGIYFYNFTSPEFNVNVCQLPFWALVVFYSWKSIKYEKSSDLRMNHFISFLENKGVVIKVRRRRGKDIDAACGQLANKKSLKK